MQWSRFENPLFPGPSAQADHSGPFVGTPKPNSLARSLNVKIVCIIHSLDGGGAERVMASLASRLVARKHTVTLVTLDDGTVERHAVDERVARQRLNLMLESRGLAAKYFNTRNRVTAIRAVIGNQAPDVVLSFCDRTNILALMASRALDIPVVVSERSDPAEQNLGTVWEYLRGRSYSKAATIIALTESSAAHLRERFTPAVRVIPSAVELPPIQSERESAMENRRILGVGRFEREKGFDRLIDAFAAIATSRPDWSLRILGEGSERANLESQIRELELSDRVTLPGWIQPVWEELAKATIFALPSRYEGFPSALLEAMACGVPSVAVDCPSGPRVVINDDQSGLLVADDTSALSRGIARLIDDDAYREQIGAVAKNVVDRFGWDAMVDAYEETLLAAAGKTKS